MHKAILNVVIGSLLVCFVTACLRCPQPVLNDVQQQHCAFNSLGKFSVTESQIANWNCIHPNDQYAVVSASACQPATISTACSNILAKCTTDGPTVCGKRDQVGGVGYTTAVFANQCQLDYYNCVYPNRKFEVVTGSVSCRGHAIREL